MLHKVSWSKKLNILTSYLIIQIAFREECDQKGGTNDGSCAEGYGVCCTCKFEFENLKSTEI